MSKRANFISKSRLRLQAQASCACLLLKPRRTLSTKPHFAKKMRSEREPHKAILCAHLAVLVVVVAAFGFKDEEVVAAGTLRPQKVDQVRGRVAGDARILLFAPELPLRCVDPVRGAPRRHLRIQKRPAPTIGPRKTFLHNYFITHKLYNHPRRMAETLILIFLNKPGARLPFASWGCRTWPRRPS